MAESFRRERTTSYPFIDRDTHTYNAAAVFARGKGLCNEKWDNELCDFRFDPGDRTDSISADMKRLARLSDPRTTVYLFHCPPFGHFDFAFTLEGRANVGSRAVAEFIRANNPWLTAHGHCHEAVSVMGGEFSFGIGDSVGIAVGAGNDPTVLNGLLVDVPTRSVKRVTL